MVLWALWNIITWYLIVMCIPHEKHRVVKNHETSDSESGEELALESSYSVLPKCKWLPWCHGRGHKLWAPWKKITVRKKTCSFGYGFMVISSGPNIWWYKKYPGNYLDKLSLFTAVWVSKGLLKYLEGLLGTGVNENRPRTNIKQDGTKCLSSSWVEMKSSIFWSGIAPPAWPWGGFFVSKKLRWVYWW